MTRARDHIPFAIATIVFTVFAMSVGDALIKQMGTTSSLGVWQLFALRSALTLPLFLVAGLVMGLAASLRPRAPLWVCLRSCLLIGVWIAYYASLPHLPLSAAAAGLYTLPLFMVAFAALWTQDRVRKAQTVAVMLGFVGVTLVLRPGGEAFSPYAALPILAAMLFAAAMVLTRVKCQGEHPLALALNLHLCFVIAGLAGLVVLGLIPGLQGETFLALPWQRLDSDQGYLVLLLTASILIASIGTAIAYQKAPIAIVGTFEFAYVGFTVLWGVLFFNETPDHLTVAGLALIVTAGVLTVRQ